MKARQQGGVPESPGRTAQMPARAPSRRWAVLGVLTALAFVSGVGASSQQRGAKGQLLAAFAAVPIDSLRLHEGPGETSLPAVSMAPGFDRVDEPETANLIVVTDGRLAAGQSLGGELGKRDVPPAVIHIIVQ